MVLRVISHSYHYTLSCLTMLLIYPLLAIAVVYTLTNAVSPFMLHFSLSIQMGRPERLFYIAALSYHWVCYSATLPGLVMCFAIPTFLTIGVDSHHLEIIGVFLSSIPTWIYLQCLPISRGVQKISDLAFACYKFAAMMLHVVYLPGACGVSNVGPALGMMDMYFMCKAQADVSGTCSCSC